MASSSAGQMDAEDSAQSLLDRRQSEMGSHYVDESGIYLSSFAAAIFISAFATIGVLMLALLVALTVMLNSCESRGSGVIEYFRTSDDHHYCNVFAVHAELNGLRTNEFPAICKHYSRNYSNAIKISVKLAESYFDAIKASDHRLDVILMDVDDMLIPGISHCRKKHVEHENPGKELILNLYLRLQARGWRLILFTRKHSRYRNDTVENLISAGYSGWSSLIMRSDDDVALESWEYISGRRMELVERGYRIESLISSHMDTFRGTCLGRRNFKIANPAYYNLQIQEERF
ncbi:uncharacterized protein A4U43_C02F390 [Asparagus officinalis]|uniref:Acid phosphatase n=1 Tax=Asparagus officinalis TaxID=4686 RepID=A0A5P1FFF5_ASPOF|nr:uncharacterized protein At2g39920-like [Asparagus officinalis]XP_020252061.1 uncharacterized protein At2g39920-like [Asparagus officinalis]ONK76842.1 uncharacterized protein A4U43_C02F390 [Asparagus officinalis]